MNKKNYDAEMLKECEALKNSGAKPNLLLHSCCAPCSTAVIERLEEFFNVTVFYYNPNIDCEKEFLIRAAEQKRFCAEKGVEYIEEEYRPNEFYRAVAGREGDTEGGKHCYLCYKLRLKKTAEKAAELGFRYFTTTLSVSPYKNAEWLVQAGREVEKEMIENSCGKQVPTFLPADFKKRGGYLRSTVLSEEYGLYRQDYCGCVYSKKEREAAKKTD